MFTPTRLTLARERRGLTKRELAKRVGVSDRSITGYETGSQEPELGTLNKLALALNFPVAFFQADEPEVFAQEAVSFRSLSKMTASQRHTALGIGALALLLDDWIDTRFHLPAPDLLDLGQELAAPVTEMPTPADDEQPFPAPGQIHTPEAAAEMLRAHWGLGELPVKNMIALLESKGVRVFSLAIDAKEVDAFSTWKGGRPYVFLNTLKSAEHCRFDAAHELGHLVLHKHGAPSGIDAEREANAFASAFLMPRASVLAYAPKTPSLPALIQHKKRWGVSVAALNYRLHALGISSDWIYRSLCIQIAQAGYRVNEPEGLPHEKSQVLEKIFASLKAEGMTRADVAAQVALNPAEIDALTFGVMLNVINGGRQQPSTASRRGHLRLVKG